MTFVIANVSLSGNCTSLSTTGRSMSDFFILKAFNVSNHPQKAPKIIEVLWQPPIFNWIKCNTDGTTLGSHGQDACAGIFRNCNGDNFGMFCPQPWHIISNALNAGIMGVILAIETTHNNNWHHLLIECDSKLATLAFKSPHIVPCHLKTRWNKCLHLLSSMNFMISHIFREDNNCANKLANLGLSLQTFTWWHVAPNVILEDLVRNKLGLPDFRFC